MYSFRNDYAEGAHPDILKALLKYNDEQQDGYGEDEHTRNAVSRIRDLVGDEEAEIHLLSGGTQTNLIAISSFLRPHEAVITAASGHIATHEAGAIEATGHKLLTVAPKDGKISPEQITPILTEHHFEHMVKPRLVYISNPTEFGTVYTLEELRSLSKYCREHNLLLYADGARLGAALAGTANRVTLKDMYTLTDAFFIGGTKLGTLLGEALVVRNRELRSDLRYLIKQRGGLLAKGRILGIQFEELFRDDLYFRLARHENETAQILAVKLKKAGCRFLLDSPTNQIFPVLPNKVISELEKAFGFYVWAPVDADHSAIRLVISWATPKEAVEQFIEAYEQAVSGQPITV